MQQTPGQVVEARVRSCLGQHVELDDARQAYAPVEFHVPQGEEGIAVAFGTDAPHMRRWGQPLLFGCGSIRDAHTDHEKVSKKDLALCTERHVRTVRDLFERAEVGG